MSFLRAHRMWLFLLILAAIIIAGSGPALDMARGKAAKRLAEAQAAHAKADQDLTQLRADVEAARKLNRQIDHAHAEEVLAPADRLKAAVMLEKEAGLTKLAHFNYTLAPEEHVSVSAGGEPQDLALSIITLAADARDDVSVYSFVDRVRYHLPGRARIKQLSVVRIGPGISAMNVHFEATLEWLSNGSFQTIAGVP